MTGYEALRQNAAFIDLSARGKLRVTGEDRARLLHAMSTGHVQGLASNRGIYTFFLNDKGRILADAVIYNLGESLLLDTEPETATKLGDHLDRYIIADDATVEDETGQWAVIALEGPQSADMGARLGIPVPYERYSIVGWKNGFVARTGITAKDGLRIFLPLDEKELFVQSLRNEGVPEADDMAARTVRIENGIPRYGEEITERYLVQETQLNDAVNPNKGCYLGQEIVERVRSRGQVHRLLAPVRIEGNAIPAAGTKLTALGKDAAEIVSAAYSPALGKVVALAYVRAEALHGKLTMTLAGTEPPIEAHVAA